MRTLYNMKAQVYLAVAQMATFEIPNDANVILIAWDSRENTLYLTIHRKRKLR